MHAHMHVHTHAYMYTQTHKCMIKDYSPTQTQSMIPTLISSKVTVQSIFTQVPYIVSTNNGFSIGDLLYGATITGSTSCFLFVWLQHTIKFPKLKFQNRTFWHFINLSCIPCMQTLCYTEVTNTLACDLQALLLTGTCSFHQIHHQSQNFAPYSSPYIHT